MAGKGGSALYFIILTHKLLMLQIFVFHSFKYYLKKQEKNVVFIKIIYFSLHGRQKTFDDI